MTNDVVVFGKGETYIKIGDIDNIIKVTSKAILYQIGRTIYDLPIEVYIPKSVIYTNEYGELYIPLNFAKTKGIGWYVKNNNDDFFTSSYNNSFVSFKKVPNYKNKTDFIDTNNYYSDYDDFNTDIDDDDDDLWYEEI